MKRVALLACCGALVAGLSSAGASTEEPADALVYDAMAALIHERAASFRSAAHAPGAPYATNALATVSATSNPTCGQSATAASPGPKQPQLAGMCRTTADAMAAA